MIIYSKTLPENHNLYLFGDSHEGTILKSYDGYNETIERIRRDKIGYAVHMGDIADSVTIDDPRYDPSTIDGRSNCPLEQYKVATKELKPIKNKLITILEGNHDHKLTARKGLGNFVKLITCDELGIPFGTFSCKLWIKNRRDKQMYKIFLTHGSRSISSKSNDPIKRLNSKIMKLKNSLYDLAGDCAIMAMGHSHQLLVANPAESLYLVDDGKKIHQRYTTSPSNGSEYIHPDHRWYVNTGSYLKLYVEGISSYGERMGLSPVELGYCVIKVREGKVSSVEKIVI